MCVNIMDRKIKIAVLGCGRISEKHFESIELHENKMELVAICDTDKEVLRKASVNKDIKTYDSLEKMLQQDNIDIVSVCTPSGLHPAQVIEIARSGRHVITEKPMATKWADGLQMVKECDIAGVKLFVVKQNRKNATLQLLKKTIEKGRFGRIHMVQLNVFWNRPQEYYDSAGWRGTWEFDGGAFMNQASHYVDLLDWLIGPVEKVHAMTGTLSRNIEVEDTGVLNIKWRSGALGSMSVSMLTYPKNYEGSITIMGDKGTVRLGGVAVNEIEHWEFDEPDADDDSIKDASYQTTSVYGFGHPHYYKNVIDVLRGEADPETDGREGLKSLEILIAAYLSARDSRTISLPLEY